MEKKKEKKPEEQLTEPESSFPESLLEFYIERKEAAIAQLLLALKQVEKKNKECHERNDLLKEKQQVYIKRILGEIEKHEKEQDAKEVVTSYDVEEALNAVWQYVKDKEQLLKDLHSQIEETEQRLLVKQSERDYWLEYRNVGRKILMDRITHLEEDIKEVKDDLHKATEYYRNALKALKEENKRLVEEHMKSSKEQARENAVRYLDKKCCREVEENEWLREEVMRYRKKVSDLKASIQLLEEENVIIVTQLVDSKLQDQRVPRRLFLTQAADLQDEFPKDEMEYVEYAAKTDGGESLRSAIVPCQKKNEKLQDSNEELWEKSWAPTCSLYKDEKDFQVYVKVDPPETNLLCVLGRPMPVHKEPEEMSSRSHTEGDGISGKSDRHITAKMIKALLEEKVG
ncbi:PREDICTED: LOW QUALITY PROTEIN: coiled-coil domain-containing protein 83 [Mesitornis unicolor]|uniref:LOW QUALITY PROTEIN: coiled-coil domain-containing protein 83 n=1 Tax=Mesitornis unicolor TaxID=54374 RepID=UPI00052945FA|nr:PREDICTED: LOW QUALITY PROTEIN: coiled-coil domain-containing protein 83 [Mesitornis unicolor]